MSEQGKKGVFLMELEAVMHAMVHAIDTRSVRSDGQGVWVFSVPHLEVLMEPYVSEDEHGRTLRRVLLERLEEGARRGLWEMDYDSKIDLDIVVLRAKQKKRLNPTLVSNDESDSLSRH